MKKVLFAAIAALVMLSSCALSREGVSSNTNQNQTSVVLSQNNFNVVKQVKGECSQIYIFGIGGYSKNSLNESAMSELQKSANLTGSQALVNTNIEFKQGTILGIVTTVKAIATGTVIEFTK